MIFIALLLLLVMSGFGFVLGRRKAATLGGNQPSKLHSLPGYHGAFLAIWIAVPAALLLSAIIMFGGGLEAVLHQANPPASVSALPHERIELFFNDARALAETGKVNSEVVYEGPLKADLEASASKFSRIHSEVLSGALAAAAALAIGGFLLAYPKLSKEFRARVRVEGWVAVLLITSSLIAILTTVGIVASLVWESARFFAIVSPADFLLGTDWDPQIAIRSDQIASKGAFGALPLFVGTFLVMIIAMIIAAPVGLFSAIYLSEYSGPTMRAVIKPLLEILAGVPTVVYGFFAALTVGPLFRSGFNALGASMIGGPFDELGQYLGQVQNQMALVAGVVMGVMLIPFVSSLSDDIINSVPQSLRDGSYAMGATKSETIQKVVLPAALPGIAGALLLAMSRAIGETMIVTMAAGLQAKLTLNPLETVTTVTVQIVTLLTGDQEFDSPKTLSAFGLGLTLFVVTLILNVVALRVVQKYREQYD
jgi:phosphate transport system permease protein